MAYSVSQPFRLNAVLARNPHGFISPLVISFFCFLKALVTEPRYLQGPFKPMILLPKIKIIDKQQETAQTPLKK